MEKSLSMTVGRGDGQINGSDDRAIQAGMDYLATLGGGTLKLLPGTYHLNNAIYLRSNIRIEGSGDETVLIKNPSVSIPLAVDSDWYDSDVTLIEIADFNVANMFAAQDWKQGRDLCFMVCPEVLFERVIEPKTVPFFSDNRAFDDI